MAAERHNYVPAFDGLRAVSITMVILFHSRSIPCVRNPHLKGLLRSGWSGVDIFFVLSGFLITWILATEWEHTGTVSLKRFYERRALRLVPPYALMLVVAAIVVLCGHRPFLTLIRGLPFYATYTMNIMAAAGYKKFSSNGGWLLFSQSWSLCIEEQFYLMWAWTSRRLGMVNALRFAIIAVCTIPVYRTALYCWMNWGHLSVPSDFAGMRLHHATDTRIDTILAGCALALLFRLEALDFIWKRLRRLPGLTTVTAAGLVGTIWWAGAFESPRAVTIGYSLIALAAAAFIAALYLQPRSLMARFLALPVLVFIGRISYCVYLFHYAVIHALKGPLMRWFGADAGPSHALVALALVSLSSIAVASALHYAVELPFMAMRRPTGFLAERPDISSYRAKDAQHDPVAVSA